jgi:hypothetical protein
MPFADQIWQFRQRPQRGVIDPGPLGDHLGCACDGAGLAGSPTQAANAPFNCARSLKPASGQHVVAHDRYLPVRPGPRRSGGTRPGHRSRTRSARRTRPPRGCSGTASRGATWRMHHGLGPVIHQRASNPTEVGERAPVAVKERAQVLAGDKTAKRVARIRQCHGQRVDPPHPRSRLRPPQSTWACAPAATSNRRCNPDSAPSASSSRAIRSESLGDIQLHPLIVAVTAVLARPGAHGSPRPSGRGSLANHASTTDATASILRGTDPLRDSRHRRRRGPIIGQVLLHRAPIQTDLIGDLPPTRAGITQRLKTA